jgi:arylsulfatase A-like enzyme
MIPTNRPMLRALALLWATAAGASTAPAEEAARPNIVFILADDLGWADVGWHKREIATPNLDALAAGGVKLENHYVCPTCSPTRAALLTGRSPSRFGILEPIADRSTLALPPGTTTLADVLKSRGYRTALVGKWHLGLRPDVGPRHYGFDSTYGYFHGQLDPINHLYKNGDRTWHRDDRLTEETGHATDLLGDEAVRQIEAARGGKDPFFLYLAFSVPHSPLAEEERWQKGYEGKISEPSRRLYAAAVTHMDAAVGRVVAALERAGLRDKTLIVFTSDNGGPPGMAAVERPTDEAGRPRQRVAPAVKKRVEYDGRYAPNRVMADNTPLRGWKGSVFEGGIRVPAFANWPGTLAPRVVTTPIGAVDWLPTLARLTGAPARPEAHWEGIDVWPSLTGTRSSEAPPSDRILYWRTTRAAAVREGDWKLIVSGGRNRPEADSLLFNLAEDPYEKTDLASRNPDRVAHLREVLRRQQALDREPPPADPADAGQ